MNYYLLASGSKGNCSIFVNDENEILMIDCGISIKEIKQKLLSLNLSFENVKALLITHMHTDHSLSLRCFENNIVYVNVATGMDEYNLYDYYDQFNLLGFDIYVIPASHDSAGTSGFVIHYKNEKLTYITDTGYVHENIQKIINNSDVYLIESNHDPRMLMLTKRPAMIKSRILGPIGHLSNQDCAYVLGKVIGPNTKEIIFLHRSQEANSEEMIIETFKNTMKKMNVDYSKIKINIASQEKIIVHGSKTNLL